MTETLFDAALNSSVAPTERPRLASLLRRVEALMADGQERTLAMIAKATGGSEASVSARLRELRPAGWTVDRRKDERRRGIEWYRATRSTA